MLAPELLDLSDDWNNMMRRISATAIQRSHPTDRREATRYPIALPLKYAVLRAGEAPVTGVGESINLSRTGVLFRCGGRPAVGDSVILVVDWPTRGPGDEVMKLVITGLVLRTRRGSAAIGIRTQSLVRERELEKRLGVFWASAEAGSHQQQSSAAPLIIVEEDEAVALLVSLIASTENWPCERVGAEAARAILRSDDITVSLLVTRTPELIDELKPEVPVIVTLPEDAPDELVRQISAHPLCVGIRRPITEAGLRATIEMLCSAGGPPAKNRAAAGGPWTH